MKKSRIRLAKGLCLVGMLALCVLLAGCVVQPDDTSTSGNYVVNNNDPPFQQLPVITNTPYVPPVTVVPTSVPSSNPIVQAVTPTPTVNVGSIGVNNGNPQQVITAVTPQIIVSTNTAKPTTSSTLKNGSTGAEVTKLQKRLKELGYLTGSADGDFGNATEAAVKAFQARNGLTVDGKAGTATLNKLYSASAVKASAAATSTPKGTATLAASLKNGSTGAEVTKLQKRLKELGYLTGSADGDFGDATEKAVRAFQARNGLTVDGKAGTATLNKLYSSSALKAAANPTATPKRTNTPKPTATPTRKPTATPRPTATPKAESLDYYLRLGSSGTKVRTLQNRLIELGWLEGAANGEYNAATEYAVKAFQGRYASLWNDGIAGPDTLKTLYGAGAATSKTPAASMGVSLEQGDENGAVKAMQKRLKELGFYKNTIDGEFGSSTKAAVIAFQKANGLTANGVATTATLNRLYAADAKNSDYLKDDEDAKKEEDPVTPGKEQDPEDTTDVTVNGYKTLKWGSTGEDVKKLQQALKNRGFYDGKIDSTFGSGVYAAVKAFQKQNGLKVDGVAGPATQILLYGSSASSADTSTSLKKGSTGTAVRNLQYVLYELGYYDGKINGQYGDTTADAVRAFQINNDITPVDGVAGPKTLKVIYSNSAMGATAVDGKFDTLSRGSKGTPVVELQETLYKLGYLSEVTGEFDSATEEAVKNCQRRNGMSATGKATQDFQRLLYYGEPTPAWDK